MSTQTKPRLYHAASSYFSMIARLALVEARIDHERIFVDILFRGSQQSPTYARLNANMTVPTLVLPGRVLDDSQDILGFASVMATDEHAQETRTWVDLHYTYPIEELTFGGFLARHALARAIIPAKMAATRRRLLRLAAAHPDLADAYKKRAAIFAERERTFDPDTAVRLAARRSEEAIELLNRLEIHLGDGRDVMVPPAHGAADIVWTVFLARMEFVGMKDEFSCRPALMRYWCAMKGRPSFAAADIWTSFHAGRILLGIIHG